MRKILFSILTMLSSSLGAINHYEIQDIGTLETRASMAIDLNDHDQILGFYNIDGAKDGNTFFLRDVDGSFYEIPKKDSSNVEITWKYLTNRGQVYGINEVNATYYSIYCWDKESGIVKKGDLPNRAIVAVNDLGQVLLSSVEDKEDGKPINRPAIWKDGQITILKGLEGNLGLASGEASGRGINNKGEVVGLSVVQLVHKNNIYTQIHAVKWSSDGKAIDLHSKIPKTSRSFALSINDEGDILICDNYNSYKNKIFLVCLDDNVRIQYGCSQYCCMNRVSNGGFVYNGNEHMGFPVALSGFSVYGRNGDIKKDICTDSYIQQQIEDDNCSEWMRILKLRKVNGKGDILAQGETIYGEQHIMLLKKID